MLVVVAAERMLLAHLYLLPLAAVVGVVIQEFL